MNYDELGLKMGLEIHQQLNTDKKLFCPCKCDLTDKKSEVKIKRGLRPTQSELGKIDRAAFEEARRKLQFIYEAYEHHTCLVEADEEPPHPLNPEALEIALILAELLHMQIVDEFHIMRKQVIDGSNTGGFQRTGLVASEGYLETDQGRVIIENLCLEEDAARRTGQKKGKAKFRLDRLGIPLVEITTDPSIKDPEQVKEVAYQLGQVLRSTKVKRGLGTIRQDLNISIEKGARVEIKGVQNLDMMPKMVVNEVKRQINLLKIREVLLKRDATIDNKIYDLNHIFEDSNSKIISKVLSKKGKILGIILKSFSGLIGKEIQPNRRFGTELASYAKKMGVSGIFHSDELPAYGISLEEVEEVKKFLDLKKEDAFVLVADEGSTAKKALNEVQRRARIALVGIPEETRKALDDGNTEYLRPLPTASRMYVETDIPSIVISDEYKRRIRKSLPELPMDKKERIIAEHGLSDDLALQLVRMGRADQFEILEKKYDVDPTIIASTLAYTLKELKRENLDIDVLDLKVLGDTLKLIEEDKVPVAGIPEILRGVILKDYTPSEAAEKAGLEKLSEDEIRNIIQDLVIKNKAMVQERGMAAMGPLMGMAMKKLGGKAEGKIVNKILKEELQKINDLG